jgi:hypothetical protein
MAKKPDRRAPCQELVTLRKKHADAFAREKEIKSTLTASAGEEGENFKIAIDGLGVVKVSAPKEARCTGTAPEVVVETFVALPERGVVKIAQQWTGKYYGSVTAELF